MTWCFVGPDLISLDSCLHVNAESADRGHKRSGFLCMFHSDSCKGINICFKLVAEYESAVESNFILTSQTANGIVNNDMYMEEKVLSQISAGCTRSS